jgi:hypothetical protein
LVVGGAMAPQRPRVADGSGCRRWIADLLPDPGADDRRMIEQGLAVIARHLGEPRAERRSA